MLTYTKWQNAALLLTRFTVAAVFMYAGTAKWAFWSAAPEGISAGMHMLIKFLSIVEPLGALALIVGFLTRWAAAGLAIIMVGAALLSYFTMGASFFTGPTGSGIDYHLLLLAGTVILLAFGAGQWSTDDKL